MSGWDRMAARRWASAPVAAATATLASLVAAILSVLPAPVVAQQPAPPQRAAAVLILDGSNSMNARLPNDKALKFVAVREALRASLPRVTPGSEFGLAAFGARRASDCRDAEVLVPPSPDHGRVIGALESFQPRGFSPVVLALRTAAASLPRDAAKASLVLVIDDLASCRGEDPCAVAADLKRQNQALAIHVVGLGLRPADTQVLTCVARQTGGQLINAADGPAVGPAIEQALALASLERAAARPAESAAAPEPKTGPAVRTTQGVAGIDASQPGVHLTVRLADGTPTLLLPIEWRIWRAEAARANGAPLIEVTAPALSRVLANGRYEVEAKSGLVATRRTIEVASQAPQPVTLDLDAGLLVLAAPLVKGGQPAAAVAITVLAFSPVADVRNLGGTPLWIGRGGSHDLVVPPGSYRVSAAAGLAGADRVVTVGRGVVAEVELPLAAGRIVVEDQSPFGPEAGATQLIVETDDPDSPAGRREIYRALARQIDTLVPAGSYVVTVRRDTSETRERMLVRPGETVARAVTPPTTRLRLVSRIGNSLPAGLPVSYRIERLDQSMRAVQRWGEAEPVVEVSPGRYRIEARIGQQNAVVVRDYDIRPGPGEARIELDTGSGGVQLKVGGGAGLVAGEVFWQIYNERGEAVWRTGQAEPLLALSAGRYRVRAEVRDRTLERTIDVRAGDNRVFEVG